MPGTLGGAFLVDYLGPKKTMLTGLILQAIIGFIMSGAYKALSNHIAAFAVVYGIFLSFGELGPGNCLGLLASKAGPTAIRGQFYGTAAAIGKVGAFAGTWAFPPLITAFSDHGKNPDRGNTGPFWVGSGLAILSAIVTFFFVVPLTHDGMHAEDIAVRSLLPLLLPQHHRYQVLRFRLTLLFILVPRIPRATRIRHERHGSPGH